MLARGEQAIGQAEFGAARGHRVLQPLQRGLVVVAGGQRLRGVGFVGQWGGQRLPHRIAELARRLGVFVEQRQHGRLVLRREARQGGGQFVVQDPAARFVVVPGLRVAPAQQAQQAQLRGAVHELRRAHAQVRPAFAVVVLDGAEQAFAVLEQPVAALQGLQPRLQVVVQREQMAHIVGGIFELRRRQRAAQPVRAGLALGQVHAGDLQHQLLVAHAGAEPGQAGGDLGVEQRPRQGAAGALEGDQVFAGAVHDLEDVRVAQPRRQRLRHARDQWVDQQDFVAHGHLHQRQLRPVGPFADEFGIQADAGRSLRQPFAQLGGLLDPVRHVISVDCRVCSGRRE
ncbi:hypothetical protein NB713_003911 [Xanthomonas sacchari]|nr:hypothetical protein [Xanthomonas sacchari]